MSRILVIDDHPAICFAVKAILSPLAEDEIHTASDGITALACLKQYHPDLIILDIMLNKMDGLQLLTHIRQLMLKTCVVVYTSLPAETYAPRAFQAGATAFFDKNEDIRLLMPLCQLALKDYACFPSSPLSKMRSSSELAESPLSRLSDRELTVMRYLSEGLSNNEIASRLLLSNKTISTYKQRLMTKLNLRNVEAMADLLNAADKNA